MPIRLLSAGGGSLTLDVPSSTSNLTMNVPVATGTLATQDNLGFRNRIINGDMRIWQRGTSIVSDTGYSSDRWTGDAVNLAYSASISHTRSRVADTHDGSPIYAMAVTSGSTSPAFIIHEQPIENLNSYDLSNKPVTVSFKVKRTANIGGVLDVRFASSTVHTGSLRDTGNSINVSNNITSISTSQYTTYTATFTCPVLTIDSHLRVGIYFRSISGAPTNTELYRITDIQLEAGSVATPFERRPFGTELALCQRYYQTLSHIPAVGVSTTAVQAFGMFPTQMRATPSVGATGPLNYQGDSIINSTQSSVSFANNLSNNFSLNVTAQNFGGISQSRTLYLAVPANNGNVITLLSEI
jgi:hypothetical protein